MHYAVARATMRESRGCEGQEYGRWVSVGRRDGPHVRRGRPGRKGSSNAGSDGPAEQESGESRNPDRVLVSGVPVRLRSAHAARRRLSAATTLLRCGRSRSISRKMPTVVEEISAGGAYENTRASCEDDVGFAACPCLCLCFCPVPHTPIEGCMRVQV